MPTPALVITASVVSGVISETAPTRVVLPTPKPPAMTIFAEVRPALRRGRPGSEPAKSTQHPLQQIHTVVVTLSHRRLVEGEQAIGDHVGDQNPGHSERQPGVRGDLRQRQRAVVA